MESLVAPDGPLNDFFTDRRLLSSFLAVTHLDDVHINSSSTATDKTEAPGLLQASRAHTLVRILSAVLITWQNCSSTTRSEELTSSTSAADQLSDPDACKTTCLDAAASAQTTSREQQSALS